MLQRACPDYIYRLRSYHCKMLVGSQTAFTREESEDSVDAAVSSLCLIIPESTRIGISAASHGASPKHSACAIPNLGLPKRKKKQFSQIPFRACVGNKLFPELNMMSMWRIERWFYLMKNSIRGSHLRTIMTHNNVHQYYTNCMKEANIGSTKLQNFYTLIQ